MMNKKISEQKFFLGITVLYIVLMISANVMALKVVGVSVGHKHFDIDAGTVTYPLMFMIGNILAEIFGYRKTKKVILWGFFANFAFCIFCWVGTFLPALDPADPLSTSFDVLFRQNPRILMASFAAYLIGSLLNAASLVWLQKIIPSKKLLFLRTIGSTVLGALADTSIFMFGAWLGRLKFPEIANLLMTGYGVKLFYECFLTTPFAIFAVPFVRKKIYMEDNFPNIGNE